jgi:hypothetical protein
MDTGKCTICRVGWQAEGPVKCWCCSWGLKISFGSHPLYLRGSQFFLSPEWPPYFGGQSVVFRVYLFIYLYFFLIFIRICSLYREDSLWQFRIGSHCTLVRLPPPTLLPAPLKAITRGFIVYFVYIYMKPINCILFHLFHLPI